MELIPSFILDTDKDGKPIIPALPYETFEVAVSAIPILREHLPKFDSLNIQLPLGGSADLQRMVVEQMRSWSFLRELHLTSIKEYGPDWPPIHEKCVRLIKVKEEMENLIYNHPKFENLCKEKFYLETELAEELQEYDEDVNSNQMKFYFAKQLAKILRGLPPNLKILSLENNFVNGFVLNAVANFSKNLTSLKIGGHGIKFDPPNGTLDDFIPLLDRLREFSVGKGFPWADRL